MLQPETSETQIKPVDEKLIIALFEQEEELTRQISAYKLESNEFLDLLYHISKIIINLCILEQDPQTVGTLAKILSNLQVPENSDSEAQFNRHMKTISSFLNWNSSSKSSITQNIISRIHERLKLFKIEENSNKQSFKLFDVQFITPKEEKEVPTKKILTDLSIESPLDETSASTYALYGSISHRASLIASLQKKKIELKKELMKTSQDNNVFTLYMMENLQMMNAIRSITRKQSFNLSQCSNAFKKAQISIESQVKSHQEALQRIIQKTDELKNQSHNKNELLGFTKGSMQDKVKALFRASESPVIQSLKSGSIISDIENLLKDRNCSDSIEQLKQLREGFEKDIVQFADALDMTSRFQQAYIGKITEELKTTLFRERIPVQIENLTQQIAFYEQQSHALDFKETKNWISAIEHHIDLIRSAINASCELYDEFLVIETDTIDEAYAEEETQKLSEEIRNLRKTETDLLFQLAELQEEEFSLDEKILVYEEWQEGHVSKGTEDEIMRMKKFLYCPKCKVNLRNKFIQSCGHPCCEQCIEQAEHKCPVCQKKFKESDITPFYLQS